METFIAVTLILAVTLLPVYLYSRSRPLTAALLAAYITFLAIYRDFLYGNTGAWHDTFHHGQIWAALINQWFVTGTPPEWSPYLGAGMPMAVFSNNIIWAPIFILSKIFHLPLFHFSQAEFFNLLWISLLFAFTSGIVLLAEELFHKRLITFAALASVLFGGLLACELGEDVVMLYFNCLPYLFFFLIRFYRTARPGYLVLFSLLYGISVNEYLPTYTFLVLASFFTGFMVFYRKKAAARFRMLFVKALGLRGLALCLLVFLATAGPALYSYYELRDYVSPSRAMARAGELSISSLKQIPAPVNVPLKSYLKMVDSNNFNTTVRSTHWPFYVGLIPGFLFLYGLTLRPARILWFAAVPIGICALGFSTPIWPWVVSHLPLVSMTRQIFGFSRVMTLIFLFISLYGLKGIANPRLNFIPKIVMLAASSAALFFLVRRLDLVQIAVWTLGTLLLAAIAFLARKKLKKWTAFACILVFVVYAGDLLTYSWRQARKLNKSREAHILPLDYPANWVSTCDKYGSWLHYDSIISGLPFELRPMIRKLIVWSYPDPSYIFMMQKDFAAFSFGADMQSKAGVLGSIFYILDRHAVDAMPAGDYYPLKLANLPLEFFTGAKVSSFMQQEENGLSAIDLNPLTFWHIDLKQRSAPAWIELSYPFPVEVSAVRILPRYLRHDQFWSSDHAILQTSSDGKNWQDIMRLEVPDERGGNTGFVFRLAQPVRTQHLRVAVNDPDFLSLAELQVVDSNRSVAIEKARVQAKIDYRRSQNPSRVSLVVTASQDSYLLRLENFHRNWKLYIDGRRDKILRIPPNFQMIALPAGRHEIVFEYHSAFPALVGLHIFFSIAGWFAFAAILYRQKK